MTVQIIAECGCNHMGDMNVAKDMIDIAAALCKVDAVKFQNAVTKNCLMKKNITPRTRSRRTVTARPTANTENIWN